MGEALEIFDIGVKDRENGVDVMLLPTEHVLLYWPQIRPMLEATIAEYPYDTVDSLFQQAMEGRIQVWLVANPEVSLVLFSSIETYVTGCVFRIGWAFGKLDRSIGPAVDAAMDNFAAMHGCKRIDVVGREGWEKILRPWKFKRISVTLSRPVPNRSMQ